MIGELFSHDFDMECFRCRVEGECNQADDKCGIKRGIKYGIYPASAIKAPTPAVNSWIVPDVYGMKEIPIFDKSDRMKKFYRDVSKYKENKIYFDLESV